MLRFYILIFLLPFVLNLSANNKLTGCVTENNGIQTKLELKSGQAIGQTFKACTDGFLSHFSVQVEELAPEKDGVYINVFEVINNKLQLIYQGNEKLGGELKSGFLNFWLKERIPVYTGREYAVELLNLSTDPFKIYYSPDDSYPHGSLIVEGQFSFSDLQFSVGIKDEYTVSIKESSRMNGNINAISKEDKIFQSWSNKNLSISYGEIGQSFQVKEDKKFNDLGIMIKNSKSKVTGVVEVFQGGLDLENRVYNTPFVFSPQKGERWEIISFSEPLEIKGEAEYYLSFKFYDEDTNLKFYYSTADPFTSGDMFMADLSFSECDLSFFLQEENDDFMNEIEWLEENQYEDLEKSPLAIKDEKINRFKTSTYPNPFEQSFMLSYENMSHDLPLEISLTNLSGTILWEESYVIEEKDGLLTISLDINLSSGKYNLRISQADQVQYSSIVHR